MEDLLEYTLNLTHSSEYMDARLETFSNTILNSINSEITKALTYTKRGIGIRVLYKGAWGFASTQTLDKENIKLTLEIARKMAKIQGERTKNTIKLAEIPINEENVEVKCEIDFRKMSIEEKVKNVLEWNSKIKNTSPAIVRSIVDYASIAAEKYFWSSEGTKIKFIRPIVFTNLGGISKGKTGVRP
ncbi:MAG: PmbA/TldA family metallopeptidase, partial [Candidatus Hodarchaeales archaeon]